MTKQKFYKEVNKYDRPVLVTGKANVYTRYRFGIYIENYDGSPNADGWKSTCIYETYFQDNLIITLGKLKKWLKQFQNQYKPRR